MNQIPQTPSSERAQYWALAALSLGAIAATGILSPSHGDFFRPYFGPVYPLVAVALASVAGVCSLRFLQTQGWFEIYLGRDTLRGVAVSAGVAALLAVPTILLDLHTPFPRGLNVPLPQSLLFYPAMGYVVEISFHALPLALLLFLLAPIGKKLGPDRVFWTSIVFVALLEPVLQVLMGASGRSLSWIDVYVGLHVLAFNFLQLWVFRRYDFVSMFSFRMVYYLLWHIGWGYLRLRLLF